jgi:hypothetical protein
LELAATVLLLVQVRDDSKQLHPVPDIAVAVNPAGSVSITVTVPEVEDVPLLRTTREYVAPV